MLQNQGEEEIELQEIFTESIRNINFRRI